MVLVGEEEKEQAVPYTPVKIPSKFGGLRRIDAYFVKQNMKEKTFVEQPFIPRSGEQASVDFVAEYYRYSCNPTEYIWTKVKMIWYDEERFDINPEVLKTMTDKLGSDFTKLKVYPFFEKLSDWETYRPTHDLICHMFMMNRMANVPIYLARGHLWDPEKATEQFNYYTGMLIHNEPNIIPNQAWLIELLKRIVTIIRDGEFWRLMEIEIDAIDLVGLLSKWPYEELIREQLCLVNNITEWDTVWFKLTPTGAMFLYMCCPRVR